MDENVEFYYYALQENISLVEEDEENKDALKAVSYYFKKVLEYIKIFLIANKERYYGYFLMDMDLRISFYSDTDAAVDMDTMPFELLINPLLLGRRRINEMIYIICHEIEHIVLEHPVAAKIINQDFDPWRQVALNYAMDASVNDCLDMEIKKQIGNLMSSPADAVTSSFLSEEYGISFGEQKDYLYYYKKIETLESQIIENSEYSHNDKSVINENGFNSGSVNEFDLGSGGLIHEKDCEEKGTKRTRVTELYKEYEFHYAPAEIKDIEDETFWDDVDSLINVPDKEEKKETKRKKRNRRDSNVIYVISSNRASRIITEKNRPIGMSLHRWTHLDMPDEIREQLRQFVQMVVESIPEDRRCLLAGHDRELLERVLKKPAVQWESVLRKYIGVIPNGYRKTRTRLDRRQPERFDISGKIATQTIDIVVAIDTSGSMSDKLLKMIFNEIFSIVKDRAFRLTIIECDTKIQKVYEAKGIDDVNLVVHGRGGTSFSPVIKYLNENKQYRKSLLIFFTDGGGEKQIPYPQVYRMLWVLPYGGRSGSGKLTDEEVKEQLSVRKPYGDVISMNLKYPYIG